MEWKCSDWIRIASIRIEGIRIEGTRIELIYRNDVFLICQQSFEEPCDETSFGKNEPRQQGGDRKLQKPSTR